MTASSPRRHRWWRIALVVLGAAVLVLAGAYVALLRAFPPARLAELLSEQVRAATGRDFRIGGGLSLQLLPTIAVVAKDVVFANAPWGSRPEMATVKRAAFEVAVSPLLDGQLHVLSVDIDGADVLLETDERGRANWIFARDESAPKTTTGDRGAPPPVRLDRLKLSDSRFAFRVGLTKVTRAVDIEALQVVNQGDRNTVSARFGGQHRWRLEGKTGRYEALVQGEADWPFEARLSSDGATLAADGSLDTGGTLQAKVSLRIDSVAALAPLLGDASALPLPIDASATLRRSATTVTLDALSASIGGQRLSGKVTVHTRPSGPRVEMELAAAAIDLSRWGIQPAPKRAAAPATSEPPFADTPLPALSLPETPLRASLHVDQLTIGPGMPPLSAVKARIQVEADRMLADPLSFTAVGGTVQARLEVGARAGEPLRLKLRGQANALSLQALDALRGSGGHVRGGRVDVRADLAAAGRTPHELAASLDGTALLSAADASLVGGAAAMERNVVVALLQALLPKQETEKPLQIECAVVHLPLHGGVARVDRSIAMETDKLAMAASGELNLGAQTVSLSFEPKVKKGLGLDSANLARLVMLQGPLQSPQVRIDMKGTAREAANLGAAVATAGLTLVGKRLLAKPEDTQACKHALGAAAP
ncbi:MAG TPA: AsmA family protein [Burkholderiaceae bacterium]|nr:AsmA family protein [Burkholderiaceae bacterium]